MKTKFKTSKIEVIELKDIMPDEDGQAELGEYLEISYGDADGTLIHANRVARVMLDMTSSGLIKLSQYSSAIDFLSAHPSLFVKFPS